MSGALATPAWPEDWHAYQPAFERLIALHCANRFVVHPDLVPPCIEEQSAAMRTWTQSASSDGADLQTIHVLTLCRARWSAVPNTNWVKALDCTRSMLQAPGR